MAGNIRGGLFSHENSSVHYVNNTIFWNLDANEEIGRRTTGSIIHLSNMITSQEILGCSLSNEYNCTSMSTANPMFNDMESGDYSLQQISPAIDMGTTDLDGDGIDYTLDTDDQDPDGTRLDIGAYYYHQVDPPSNLTADAGDGLITLSWDESSNGENYNVYQGDGLFDENNYSLSFDGIDDHVNLGTHSQFNLILRSQFVKSTWSGNGGDWIYLFGRDSSGLWLRNGGNVRFSIHM